MPLLNRANGIAVLMLGFALPLSAQVAVSKVASVSAFAKPAVFVRGGKGVLTIVVTVAPEFHINANKPNDKDLIPTIFTAGHVAGVRFGAPVYPRAETIHVGYEPKPMAVYEGKTTIRVPFVVAKNAKLGSVTLTGALGYQGCNKATCYPPTSSAVTGSITIK